MDRAKAEAASDGRATDGVRMAILSSRMESIARKMQNTLFRPARSGVVNTAPDFPCRVLLTDPSGTQVASAPIRWHVRLNNPAAA